MHTHVLQIPSLSMTHWLKSLGTSAAVLANFVLNPTPTPSKNEPHPIQSSSTAPTQWLHHKEKTWLFYSVKLQERKKKKMEPFFSTWCAKCHLQVFNTKDRKNTARPTLITAFGRKLWKWNIYAWNKVKRRECCIKTGIRNTHQPVGFYGLLLALTSTGVHFFPTVSQKCNELAAPPFWCPSDLKIW